MFKKIKKTETENNNVSKKVNSRKPAREKKEKTKDKSKREKIVRNIFLGMAGVFIVAGAVFGIHEWKNINSLAKRTSFSENEAAKINGESVSMAEFMLYSIDVKNGYEAQYGTPIWTQTTTDANGDEDTFENVAKESTFEQIRFVWALVKEGEKQGIKMTDEETKAMDSTAEEYFKTLTDAGISTDIVTVDDIKKFYSENYLAQKVYYKLTGISANGLTKAEVGTESTESAETADSTEEDTQLTTEEMQALWEKLIDEYYPEFDYDLDINWTLINEVSFASEESIQSTESVDSTEGMEAYYETQGTENIDSTEEN